MSSSATLPLSKLREGQKGQVSDLLLSGEMRRRLQDLGLIPGALCFMSLSKCFR